MCVRVCEGEREIDRLMLTRRPRFLREGHETSKTGSPLKLKKTFWVCVIKLFKAIIIYECV